MTTLLTVGTSDGVRRCDARCHDAHAEKCTCVCGGRNHGVGHDQALTNLREDFDGVIKEYAKRRGVRRSRLKVRLSPEATQLQFTWP